MAKIQVVLPLTLNGFIPLKKMNTYTVDKKISDTAFPFGKGRLRLASIPNTL